MIDKQEKIVLFGAAGLVGQNLSLLLAQNGYTNLVGIDKHVTNTAILRQLNPGMQVIEADLAQPGEWQAALHGAKAAVMLQAQIGGEIYAEFVANNIDASKLILAACRDAGIEYLVHISSSVVNSAARDFYTETKKEQERLVRESGLRHCVLRPTLMFGWFDRKHLGWLARFMRKTPVFPIPGSGRYMRQPLYALDFCRIIQRCIETQPIDAYNITGCERIDYIDLIRHIRNTTGARAAVLRIPYALFYALLSAYALVDKNPPFTTQQLKALVTPDEFELIPWGELFEVRPTPIQEALAETFTHPRFAGIALEF